MSNLAKLITTRDEGNRSELENKIIKLLDSKATAVTRKREPAVYDDK